MDDMEVKADALEGAFDAVLAAEAVDELKVSVAALKAQVDAQAVAASRLPLDGAKAADPARNAFVERYLRRGIDAGVEMKSLSGASGGTPDLRNRVGPRLGALGSLTTHSLADAEAEPP